ncbi:hypothetical protein NIES22_47880 [Calothrix brevissima NIES-22]|nr:hypothetical protein NIES22_47880 [Calothrix brevissima NIES-22]
MIRPIQQSQLFGLGILLPLVTQSPDTSFFPYQFIWPLFAAINIFNLIYMGARVAAIVRENPELEGDSRVFLKWLFIFAVLPFLLLYLFQILGGFHNSLYVFSNDYHNPYIVLGWVVFILLNLGILYSILWGGGASMLIKFRKAFRSMPESEMQIKVMTVFNCLVGAVALFSMIATNTFGKLHG